MDISLNLLKNLWLHIFVLLNSMPFAEFNGKRHFKKIQPHYLSSSYRCGKGCFWIKVLRLILILQKNLSDSFNISCLKSDKFLVNKRFTSSKFILLL